MRLLCYAVVILWSCAVVALWGCGRVQLCRCYDMVRGVDGMLLYVYVLYIIYAELCYCVYCYVLRCYITVLLYCDIVELWGCVGLYDAVLWVVEFVRLCHCDIV